MSPRLILAVCLSTALSVFSAHAQEDFNFRAAKTVAYVYVVSLPASATATEIRGYTAASDGSLTEMNGSPFQENESAIAVNGKYLFGVNRTAQNIDSYSMESNGELRYVTSTNWAQNNPDGCGSPAWLFTDRTSSDVYDMEIDGDCANNGYQSYGANVSTGELNYLGYANGGAGSFMGVYLPATFLGDNRFAYEATNNSCYYFGISGFQRAANGVLSPANISWTAPAPPSGYRIYIPTFAAADSSSHVAMTLWAANPPGCSSANQQIASFTADAQGNLTTKNTSADMPSTQVANVLDLKVSPSGRLLAVAGQGGLQVFHFNGANAPTSYTPLLTTDTINQMFWDNDNHLYAVSQSSGKLHVFTVNPTGYGEAPGSPYAIAQPGYIAVQPEAFAIAGLTLPRGRMFR